MVQTTHEGCQELDVLQIDFRMAHPGDPVFDRLHKHLAVFIAPMAFYNYRNRDGHLSHLEVL